MAAEAGRATPVRRVALGPRMTASSRFLAVAAALAVILVAGGLLLVSGQRGPVGPSSSLPPLAITVALGHGVAVTVGECDRSGNRRAPDGARLRQRVWWTTAGSSERAACGQPGAATSTSRPTTAPHGSSAAWCQASLPNVDQCGCPSSVFVLDATHAWSASPGPGSTPYDGQGPPIDKLHVVVSRSSDGGKTWRSVSVPGDWGGSEPVLAFADASHGYLLLAGLRGGGASGVFATADGGATWRLMGGSSSIGRLGSIFGVTSSQTLWSGNQGDAGPVGRPILDVSRDGGRTWSDARLPGLIGDIYVNDTLVAPPVITGLNGAVAVLAESSANPR